MQVACQAEDYNITLDRWLCPSPSWVAVDEDESWFADLFAPYTRTTSLAATLATLPRSSVSGAAGNTHTLYACDEVGHCVSQTITDSALPASQA